MAFEVNFSARQKFIFTTVALLLCTMLSSETKAQLSEDSSKSHLGSMIINLDEILDLKSTSATKFEEALKDLSSSVTVITKSDIQRYGYRSLSEALQHVPGMYSFDDHTPYKENFGIRGTLRDEWNQNIIFLVNGIRQRSGYSFNNILSYINVPIESVERIEVIKGPAAVTYGSGAFLGVVNIITIPEESQSNVYGAVGNMNTYKAGLNISRKTEDFKVNLNSGFMYTDGINQNYKDMGLDTNLLSGRFMNEKQLYVNLSGATGDFVSSISLDRNQNNRPVISPPFLSKDYEGDFNALAARYMLGYNHTFGEKTELNGSFQYQYQQEKFQFDVLGLDLDQETQITSVNQYEVDVNARRWLHKRFNISLGANYFLVSDYSDNIDLPLVGLSRYSVKLKSPMHMWGGYLRTFWSPVDKIQVRAGARIDQIESFSQIRNYNTGNAYLNPSDSLNTPETIVYTYPKTDPVILPEISLKYIVNKRHQINLNFGKAINRIPIFRMKDIVNYNIQPEYINSIELNHTSFITKKMKLTSGLILNNLKNLVAIEFELDTVNLTQLQRSSNSGNIRVYGIETQVEYRLFKNFQLQFAANYYYSEDQRDKNIYPAYAPKFLGNFALSYSTSFLSIAMTNVYVGPIETKYSHKLSDPNDLNSPEIGRAGTKAPGYLNSGFNARLSPKLFKGAYLNARVSNVFDQKMYYPVNDFNSWATRGTLGIGRTYLVSIGYVF